MNAPQARLVRRVSSVVALSVVVLGVVALPVAARAEGPPSCAASQGLCVVTGYAELPLGGTVTDLTVAPLDVTGETVTTLAYEWGRSLSVSWQRAEGACSAATACTNGARVECERAGATSCSRRDGFVACGSYAEDGSLEATVETCKGTDDWPPDGPPGPSPPPNDDPDEPPEEAGEPEHRSCREMERETGIEPATNGLEGRDSTTELLPRPGARRRHGWWRRMDSNHRRLTPADLQSAAIVHSATPPGPVKDAAHQLEPALGFEPRTC